MLSKLEEIKLVSQCAFGDSRGAFGKLVEAYQPQLRRFLLNLTMGDENLTDDLAQETFIKAYTGIRAFKGLSGFGTWLYRIAYNEFYSEKRRRHEEHIDQIPESMQDASAQASISTEAPVSFHRAHRGWSRPCLLPDIAASFSPVRTLSVNACGIASSPEGGAFQQEGNVIFFAKSSPFGGAVTVR